MSIILSSLSRARTVALLDRMRTVRVGIVGDVMLDRYLVGDVERISPEAPVPVVIVQEERSVAGGAANVAANVLALGGRPSLVGVIGDDASGDALQEALTALGIDTAGLIRVSGRPTTTKTRILARGQQVVRIDREVTNALPERFREQVANAAARLVDACDVLVISDYAKGVLDAELATRCISAARLKGIPVVVDPKPPLLKSYQGATVLTPNRRELEAAVGSHFTVEDDEFESIRRDLGVDHLLVTLGADGMTLASVGEQLRTTPSIALEVFDVSGAGDTVTGWTAAVLGAGGRIAEGAWLANLAAGVEVGKLGTATVSPAELLEAWDLVEQPE